MRNLVYIFLKSLGSSNSNRWSWCDIPQAWWWPASGALRYILFNTFV